MSAASLSHSSPRRRPWYDWRRWGWNVLTLSILAHLFFGTGAAYLIVQTIQGKQKQTFTAPSSTTNAPTHALEHKVQMQKKQAAMSAPAQAKRITTTANVKVALPTMPVMPRMDSVVTPVTMAGMGGNGTALGPGGTGGTGGTGFGKTALSLFGVRDSKGSTLRGTFFDLKQTADQRPTAMAKNDNPMDPGSESNKAYKTAVTQYVMGGMHDSLLTGRYFKGPNPLYATQVFIPQMQADEGPKAFGLQDRVQPSRWLVHYQGTVIPPESGVYRFVGVADDVLVVKFNGAIVLDCGSFSLTGHEPGRYYDFEGMHPPGGWFKGCGEGIAFNVTAGKSYPIDILIGEWPGGNFEALLLLRNEATQYRKDAKGNPILPIFRLEAGTLPSSNGPSPVYDHDGPIWKGAAPLPTES